MSKRPAWKRAAIAWLKAQGIVFDNGVTLTFMAHQIQRLTGAPIHCNGKKSYTRYIKDFVARTENIYALVKPTHEASSQVIVIQYKPRAAHCEARIDKFTAFYKTPEWKRAAYDAKKRMGFQCMCCGASARQHGVRIVTDHIKPIRHFWELRLEPSNLQVLCDECNVGKGARHSDDFRRSSTAEGAHHGA